ncbi:hypothetical protein BZA77DRAFT_310922 [Pyronema omphalodes]|nr:hypothetical protein BZA77DRAFT_310922 [Pyronema omphalodes]
MSNPPSTGYIFKPPPPPPPKAAADPNQQQSYNQRGRGRGGRGGDRGRGGGRGRGRGGSDGNNQRGGYNGGYNGGHPNYEQQTYRQTPQHPPGSHINPQFFPQYQQPNQPLSTAPPVSLPPKPSALQLPSLFSAGPVEAPPPPAAPLQTSYAVPSFSAPFSIPTPSTQSSPPAKSSRPDMSHAEWLALNGGKLLGTNVKPPETPEEIAAWIAERKKKFPSAARRAEAEKEDAERKERWAKMAEEKKEAELREREKQLEARERQLKEKEESLKRKREEGDNGNDDRDLEGGEDEDDDGPPEEASAKERTVMRDDRKSGEAQQKKKRKACRHWEKTGECGRGDACSFWHDEAKKGKGRDKKEKTQQKPKEEVKRVSLYQRLVEREMDSQNETLLQVIKYLVETGILKPEEAPKDMVNDDEEDAIEAASALVQELDDDTEEVIDTTEAVTVAGAVDAGEPMDLEAKAALELAKAGMGL